MTDNKLKMCYPTLTKVHNYDPFDCGAPFNQVSSDGATLVALNNVLESHNL